MNSWKACKNILCIRPDNMGDVIMSAPAFRALKQTFNCNITLLTSSMGSLITPFINEIDEMIVFDLPWIKTNNSIQSDKCIELIEKLKAYQFDAAIIFTVYSQNPLPTAMLAYMANIPLRLAYCRENPYALLTDWVPDEEPYSFIKHQVERDLNLVKEIGAQTNDDFLSVLYSAEAYQSCLQKLASKKIDINKEWIVLHPGVSEAKREYPTALWIETAKLLHEQTGKQILLSGAANEALLTEQIQQHSCKETYSIAGLLSIEEFIALIANTKLLISVNTAAVHIAVATKTPVIVLYALTNPQHFPWKTPSVVLPFSVPVELQSKNEVIQYVNRKCFSEAIAYPQPGEILKHAQQFL